MELTEDSEVAKVFDNYPEQIREKLLVLRNLILETAHESEDIDHLQETLKWGEPSYLTQGGSTIRVGWSSSRPAEYAIYFHCKTKLVDTFRELYRDRFSYAGNRAIVFQINDEVPIGELKHCIFLALTYHSRKHLPMLGV